MSEGAPVGVVGDEAVAQRLRDAGHSVSSGTVGELPDTDRVVAVGDAAARAVAGADRDPLVVPVETTRGLRPVDRSAVAAAVGGLADARVERHPVLTVRCAGTDCGKALFDVTLVTDEAARISEYAVETPAETVGQFRADGVTVATPAGSPGYARRVDGPLLAPGAGVVVAPIAPFATDPDHWVLDPDAVVCSVERDDAPVALVTDGEAVDTVNHGDAVRIERTGTLRTAVTARSQSRFG